MELRSHPSPPSAVGFRMCGTHTLSLAYKGSGMPPSGNLLRHASRRRRSDTQARQLSRPVAPGSPSLRSGGRGARLGLDAPDGKAGRLKGVLSPPIEVALAHVSHVAVACASSSWRPDTPASSSLARRADARERAAPGTTMA
eukprot:scaffold647_cov411-Prasinococcus_capsulatus_cf.AAC.21